MVIKFPLYFNPGKEDRCIHMYLPNDYYESDERYPVVYMFDGHNLFFDSDATYGKSWGLADFLDNWKKKVIIVGLECSHHGHERLSEFFPFEFTERNVGHIKGKGVQTMNWFVKTLKPHIDANFRTWPHREATAIGGSSMGGIMALFAVLRYNKVFSKSAAVSPEFFGCLPQFLKELTSNKIHPDTRLFMSWGTEEDKRGWMTKRITKMDEACQKHNIQTMLYHHQQGHHCEADWEKQIPAWMEFLWY